MIITIETGDGRILVYDTRRKELYEAAPSPASKIKDPGTIKEVEELVKRLIEEKTPPTAEERQDAYDPDVHFSHLEEIIINYYDYETLAHDFKEYARNHYIPTVTKLYKLFDKITSALTFKIYDAKDGTTTWKISDSIKITKASYDGEGYVSPTFSGITQGYWETYTPETIREYIETLSSKRKRIEKIYARLAKEHPEEIDMKTVEKAIKTLEIFRKLEG